MPSGDAAKQKMEEGCMGKIVKFNTGNEDNEHNISQSNKFKIKLVAIITALATFCTITGITLKDPIMKMFEKDWQAIAEQYNNDGLELYDLGKYEEAIELYDKAIELENKGIDDMDVCYFNRGLSYYKLGNYQKAVGDFTQAIDISSKPKYYLNRALAYEKTGDTEKAALDNIKSLTQIVL